MKGKWLVDQVRETGHLPEFRGGPWWVHPMNQIIKQRGTDIELTPDEQLVFDAMMRDRINTGPVILVEEGMKRLEAENGRQNSSDPMKKDSDE